MNARRWGIFVVAAIGVLLVPSQAMADKAPAALTIDITGSPGDYSYTGTIISPRPSCKKDRKITVYRRQPGKDEKIGSVNSFPSLDSEDKNWYWERSGRRGAERRVLRQGPRDQQMQEGQVRGDWRIPAPRGRAGKRRRPQHDQASLRLSRP